MVSSVSVDPLLVELVEGFSKVPQAVIWRYSNFYIDMKGIIFNFVK